ncbi:MAG: hypothetical protein NTY77_09690 [Elusimicrobia bacterium]|nr:hypothetical protein [Elusimicrobiota bacterium]
MELYVRFISTLAFGLIGLGAVMKVLLETIFEEWDAFNDISQRVMVSCSGKGGLVENVRAEDIMLEAEKQNAPDFNSRIVDFRRRQFRELDAIETQLSMARPANAITESDIVPS